MVTPFYIYQHYFARYDFGTIGDEALKASYLSVFFGWV